MVANHKSPRPYRVYWKDDNGVVYVCSKRAYKDKSSALLEMAIRIEHNYDNSLIGYEEIYDFWVATKGAVKNAVRAD